MLRSQPALPPSPRSRRRSPASTRSWQARFVWRQAKLCWRGWFCHRVMQERGLGMREEAKRPAAEPGWEIRAGAGARCGGACSAVAFAAGPDGNGQGWHRLAARQGGWEGDSLLAATASTGRGCPGELGRRWGAVREAEGEAASSSSSSLASRGSPSQPGSSAWFLIRAFYQLSAWAERPVLLSCRGWPRCRISPSRELVRDALSLPRWIPPRTQQPPACPHSVGKREWPEEEDGEAPSSPC